MLYPSLYGILLLLTNPTLVIGIVETFSAIVKKQSRIIEVSESSFVRSQLECSQMCAVKGNCMGYNYRTPDKLCELIDVSYGTAQDDSTFKHVSLKGECIFRDQLSKDFQKMIFVASRNIFCLPLEYAQQRCPGQTNVKFGCLSGRPFNLKGEGYGF